MAVRRLGGAPCSSTLAPAHSARSWPGRCTEAARDGEIVKITVREAARLLSVSESEIYRWIDEGAIPCHVVNHQPLFSRAELLEWATAHRKPLSTELFEDGRAANTSVDNSEGEDTTTPQLLDC